ncbi:MULTISPECIES: tetratricopeptide repeat protein [unclassified Micromonospora]|uniref:ATP-binding protein n=1 Tax=unclassified Micromonospora TaxID=2617518 RepID=UPI001C24DE91|nr:MULTISPECIES: tetratricopeptide repeat protein [unclassified Micromonospora]MBU8861598.1 tetratricopeptide repeat protein [Micromonospora sp. WMMB482]MDM4781166.1 tetratricopeptide repeat protein [Micromonospora sp. b486]
MALLLVTVSSLLSVVLAVVVNVATGGELPEPVAAYGWLAWPTVAALTLAGVGLALWQHRLTQADDLPAPSAVPSVDSPPEPSELPVAPHLTGREAELAAIEELIAGKAQVIVISAAAGTGKSALAVSYAHRVRERFPDGQVYVPLGGAGPEPVPAQEALIRMLGALGRDVEERRGTLEELSARFRSVVADLRLLVVLDDASDVAQVRPLIAAGAGCLTLVTSRRLLADLPGAAVLTLGALPPGPALELLAATVGADRVAADPSGARRLVEVCAGLPLALRIVGSRLQARPGWTPSGLADRLADETGRLGELRVGDRTIRSAFQSTYEELSDVDRLVFRRAGSHPGVLFGLESAARRCGLDPSEVRDALDRLGNAFLVEAPTPSSYRLHDLLRLFAGELMEQQEPPGDRAACLIRQLDWLRGRAGDGGCVADERDNILAVLRTAVAQGLTDHVWALVEAVHPLLTAADDHIYRLQLWRSAEQAAASAGDDRRRIRALRWVSHSYGLVGEVESELGTAQEAIALAERLGDNGELAQTTRRLGEALRSYGRLEEAERSLLRALRLFQRLQATEEEIEVRSALGTLYNTLGRPECSIPILERAAALLPATETALHGYVLLGLAAGHKLAGHPAEAAALSRHAFDVADRLDDDFLRGYCLHERGWLAAGDERYRDAEQDFRAMLEIFSRIRHGAGVSGAHHALGDIAAAQGRPDQATTEYEAAIGVYERLGNTESANRVRSSLAAMSRPAGDA